MLCKFRRNRFCIISRSQNSKTICGIDHANSLYRLSDVLNYQIIILYHYGFIDLLGFLNLRNSVMCFCDFFLLL